MTASRQFTSRSPRLADAAPEAIARRKAFLQFGDEDAARLQHLHNLLGDADRSFVEQFYQHLQQFPETRDLLADSATLERLKKSQASYFDSLTAGNYGDDYVQHRLQVGIAHQRVGLAPAWYLGAYANYLSGLLPAIWQRLDEDKEVFVDTIQSLIKVVLFDMGLAVDTYIDAGRHALHDSQAMLNRAQAVAGIGSWSMDIARNRLDWSDETYRICGLPADGGITQERFLALVHPADRIAVYGAWQGALAGTNYNIDHRIIVGGKTRWVNARAEMEFDADGRPVRAVGTIHDITQPKRADAKIRHLAFYDSLTDLPNRALCLDRLKLSLHHCQRQHQQLAVLFIDLDLFKHVNDSLGHDAGDRLLQAVAERLSHSVRKVDTVARLGGDEFVVLLQDVDEVTARRVTDKLLDAFQRPFRIDSQPLHMSCSIGMALYPRDGRDTRTLLRNADAAMYRAKSRGRNNAQFYTEDLNRRSLERLQLQEEMYDALENRAFCLHFQPRVDLESGDITALEVLIRWHHPTRGNVPPDVFIPIAEESGLITALGEWIAREACSFAVQLQASLGQVVKIAVNLSARQFWHPDLASRIAGILTETGLAAEYLEVELTESMIMHQVDQAIQTMLELKALGVSLAIDDFGTGFSSLSHLKRFPVSILKIDKTFVAGVPHQPDDIAIVTSTISLAHNMGLRVVAEGVETEPQKVFLRERGCDELQGYLFARPMPAREIIALLQGRRVDATLENGADRAVVSSC